MAASTDNLQMTSYTCKRIRRRIGWLTPVLCRGLKARDRLLRCKQSCDQEIDCQEGIVVIARGAEFVRRGVDMAK